MSHVELRLYIPGSLSNAYSTLLISELFQTLIQLIIMPNAHFCHVLCDRTCCLKHTSLIGQFEIRCLMDSVLATMANGHSLNIHLSILEASSETKLPAYLWSGKYTVIHSQIVGS